MENNSKKVSFQVFTWFTGIVIILFGVFLGIASSAMSSANESKEEISDLNTEVQVIKNDVKWIRLRMEEEITAREQDEIDAWVTQRLYEQQGYIQ